MKHGHHGLITLKDQRQLSYVEYGNISGRAMIMCHGLPGSSFEHPPNPRLMDEYDIRLIVPDRPGYGDSTFLKERSVTGYVDDIIQLVDTLGLDSFIVAGFSGGGPYAIAIAQHLPLRVSQLLLFSSSAPREHLGDVAAINPASQALFELAETNPQMLELQLQPYADSPDALLLMMESLSSDIDKQLFQQSEFRGMYRENMMMALKQGVAGIAWDMHLAAIPWETKPSKVEVPCQLWHGFSDQNAPIAMGRYLTDTLPNCKSHFLPDEGHFLLFKQWRWIAAAI